jgi:hypothetical protein
MLSRRVHVEGMTTAALIDEPVSCWMVLPIGLICWTAQNPAAAPAARQGLPSGHA